MEEKSLNYFLNSYQKEAVDFVTGVIKKRNTPYQGALIEGIMGCGKTRMGLTVAMGFENVLFVTQASCLKSIEDKKSRCLEEFGIGDNVECVSYEKFANPQKIRLSDYDFFIFDESQKLRNWKAAYTQRFVRYLSSPFLLMSGTPAKKDPRDYMYQLRKTGAFGKMSTHDFKMRYLGGEIVPYSKAPKLHGFTNEHEFTQLMNKVTFRISEEDVYASVPKPNIKEVLLPGKWIKAKDFKEETATRLQNSLNKVPHAARHISKDISEKGINTAIILCHFHEVAETLAKELKMPVALEKEKVYKEVKRIKEKGGYLITTLGLTNASYDINECDHMYLVESNYHWSSDNQSISRCRRIGKENVLNVTYLIYEDEAPYRNAMRDAWVADIGKPNTAVLSPSQVETIEKCPGSYWLPSTKKTDTIAPAAAIGHARHAEAERLIKNTEPIAEALKDDIGTYVTICRALKQELTEIKGSKYGIEDRVCAVGIDKDIRGTVDFWSFDGQTLTVIDYKNGSSFVSNSEKNPNFQLDLYAYMICVSHSIKPSKLSLIVIQRDKIRARQATMDVVHSMKSRMEALKENIQKAKEKPLEHLNPNCTSIMCRGYEYHQALKGYCLKEGGKMDKKRLEQLLAANKGRKAKVDTKTIDLKGTVLRTFQNTVKSGYHAGKRFSKHEVCVKKGDLPVDFLKENFSPKELNQINKLFKLPKPEFKKFHTDDERLIYIGDFLTPSRSLEGQEFEGVVGFSFGEDQKGEPVAYCNLKATSSEEVVGDETVVEVKEPEETDDFLGLSGNTTTTETPAEEPVAEEEVEEVETGILG